MEAKPSIQMVSFFTRCLPIAFNFYSCAFTFGIFFEKREMFSGHAECSFDNPTSSKGRGGFAAIFDSQTENFLSQKGQSTKPSETEF